jgi:membrane protease YdiL (CAAX protease family)
MRSYIGALLVTGLYPGAGGIRSIARQVRICRVHFIWYVIALVMPFVLLLAAETFSAALRRTAPLHWMTLPVFSGPGGLYFVIFGSLFAEEPGWRGFAQPRLQTHYGALTASLLIGLLWSTWHLWYVITPGVNVTGTDALATYVRAYLNRNHLCVDIQQHKRKLIHRDACTSWTQPCSQSCTDTG